MDVFPVDYVVHNLPLVVLSGLGEEQDDKNAGGKARTLLSEGGFRIRTDLPMVKGSTAQTLLQALLSNDSLSKPWHGRGPGQAEQIAVFRVCSTGRTYTLPPRKAPPPAHSPRLRAAFDGSSPPPQLVLHSPISPLTPSSPLYPSGIMTPLWITKHQSRLPSIFMSFFALVSDSNTSTLQDNKLKSEINNIRSVLSSTNYKTKPVVVLVGDGAIDISDVEERLHNIRRATNLDIKSLFYLAAESSQAEISEFSRTMLNGLYAGCIEYYRDLSKHARRKRSRNTAPQPTVQPSSGTSQTLPLASWHVRYEFKLGVFAEFRQEMEAALRNYEVAYESLFGAEVFETISSWSSRFNEARMLSDVIAIRIIRCLLWLGQTTNAVKSWTTHRNRIRSLIDRRAAGTGTYGWEAWQSIWARAMADLIKRAQVLLPLESNAFHTQSLPLFVDAEKTLSTGQRSTPWESLHHEGYWLQLAQKHTQNRRARALQMPKEDRAPPGQSPASIIASKAHSYDKYLVLEPHKEFPLDDKPGYDYSLEVVQILDAAIKHFSNRGQSRMVEILQLKRASELMKAQSWEDALTILHPIWQSQSWRKAGWWPLLAQVGRGLLTCAREIDNADLVTQLSWQLAHPIFAPHKQQDQAVESYMKTSQSQASAQAALDTEHSLTRFKPSFVFATAEGNVGEAMDAQITLQHITLDDAVTLQLSQVKIVFDGCLKPIYLIDNRDQVVDENFDSFILTEIKLEDARSRATSTRRSSFGVAAAVSADVNLDLRPGQTKIFQMAVFPREAGDVSVVSITMTFQSLGCEMTITTSDTNDALGQWWEVRREKPVPRPCGRERDAASAKILPKPPKIEIRVLETRKIFYTNESIDLVIESENHEDQVVAGSITTKLLSPGKSNAVLRWKDGEDSTTDSTSDAVTSVQLLPAKEIQKVKVGDRTGHTISISNADEALDHELEIEMDYALLSSPETRLRKVITFDIPIIRPFEANFSFHSRFHGETWPNFFSSQTVSEQAEKATGVKQQYLITAVIGSFAPEDIIIKLTTLTLQKIVGGAKCTITRAALRPTGDGRGSEDESSILIHPEETKRVGFDMTLQKLVLGNRQPVAVDVSLEIQWKRKDSEQLNTSILQVPRFLAPSAEPRVLLQATKDETVSGLYRLNYTMENPSLHFLTFNLIMESSEDFAFSGTKSKSMSLVPVSRHSITYRILSNKTKAWIKVHLEVVDAYFGQTLRVQPASEGIRVDKQGNVFMWVD